MTNALDVFNRHFVGFDDLFRNLERGVTTKTYPPHNIIRLSPEKTRIEIAAAGFSREELEVTVEGNALTVRGDRKEESDADYIFKGISTRSFSKRWTLDRHLKVDSVKLVNGLLVVDLVQEVPEEEKPKKLEIL